MIKDATEIGGRLSLYLRTKGVSQRKLARLSGVSVSIVSRFCNGMVITSDKLFRLLEHCDDLSLDWLLFGAGEMTRQTDNAAYRVSQGAGADFSGNGSVLVKNSNGVKVLSPSSTQGTLISLLAEKDRIIADKDRVIGERDEMIRRLHEMLLK